MKGTDATISMVQLLQKRLVLTGSTLRSRTSAEKGAIASAVHEKVWPLIAQGKLKPVVRRSFPLAEAADAHRALEAGNHIGKIVLSTQYLG